MVARLHGESKRTGDCFSRKGGSLQGDLVKSAAPTLRDESQGGGEGQLGWLGGLKTPGPLEGGR